VFETFAPILNARIIVKRIFVAAADFSNKTNGWQIKRDVSRRAALEGLSQKGIDKPARPGL